MLGAVATVVIGALRLRLPVGTLLDVTAPGLLFGMAIGRLGCFFGGCCAGRPTASWGLWSSDRRLGVRRVPTQLFESTLALLTGLAALAVMLTSPPDPAGVVFLGGIAAYTLGRQLLFPLRNQPRNTWLVEHRLRAVLEIRAGAPVTEVAARYGASRQSVYGWKTPLRARSRWTRRPGTDGNAVLAARRWCRPRRRRRPAIR